MKNISFFITLIMLLSLSASAEEDKFEDTDLPTESITPQLDIKSAVLNRTIQRKEKWEIFYDFQSMTDEVYLNKYKTGFSFYKNTSEEKAYSFHIYQRFGGQTNYATIFQNLSGVNLQFSRAPQPGLEISAGTQNYFHYGKISFSKSRAYPMSTAWFNQFGLLQFGSDYQVFMNWGLNQNLYLTKNWILKANISAQIGYFYDVTSVSLRATDPIPSEKSFSKKINFLQNIGLSVGYLF